MRTLTVEPLTALIDRTDPFLLVARLSLLVVLVNTHHDVPVLLFAAVVTALVFLNERALRSPWPWFGLATVVGASQFIDWWLIDDHRVATTYWLVAIGLSRLANQPERVLALSARFILGSLFALAFGWKLLSSQYMATDVFQYALLRDHRFEPVATLAGGADADELEIDRVRISDFTRTGDLHETIAVSTGPRTDTVAAVFTTWGLVLEGALAAAFLLPLPGRARQLRPALLLIFCATTYAVVPVVGFGTLLMILGLAQAKTAMERRVLAVGSAIVFVWGVVMINLVI